MRTKIFFLFALLASITASAAVTVTPLSVDYSTKKVTFRVSWTNSPAAPYNNRVWVWVDLCPITGTSPGTFAKAVINNPSATVGSIATVASNTRGFYVTTNPSTVTATLSNATGQFNWCAYGSDYPPNATVNAGGGYTLRGTKPFTINGNQTVDATTFGAGTCITTITDLTGRPDGFATPTLTITTTSPAARCGAGAVTLAATATGGTTTAMTYTWTVGGTNYTNSTNRYTTASLSASTTYTVKVKNANNCESATASGNITVNYPGTNGQTAHATCGCATGTTNCSGTCTTTGTYTTNDGTCTGACKTAYKQVRNQCGEVISTSSETYSNASCYTSSCTYALSCEGCAEYCSDLGWPYGSRFHSDKCRCSVAKCTSACNKCTVSNGTDHVYSNNTWVQYAIIPATELWDCRVTTSCN